SHIGLLVARSVASYVNRPLILAQALKARMPQPSIAGPLGEGDLRDKSWFKPHRALPLLERHLHERRLCAFERLELARKRIEICIVEAGADLTGIDQLAVFEAAEQQRREGLASHLGAAEAADDEFLEALAFDLEPVPAATRNVGSIRALRDDAFEPCSGSLLKEFLTRAFHVIGVNEEVGDALRRHQFGEPRASLLQRLLAPIFAVERQKIEHEIADGGIWRIDMLLQRLEVGDSRRQHVGDLSVD